MANSDRAQRVMRRSRQTRARGLITLAQWLAIAFLPVMWSQTVVARAGLTAVEEHSSKVPQAHINPQPLTLPVVDSTDIHFSRLSTAQGLSQARAKHIVQDDQGFVWLGTQSGLNRYDGHRFKVFTNDNSRPNSLSGVYIHSLFKDRSGSLWIGSDQFLDKFDPKSELFTHYRVDTRVGDISEDRDGYIWLATGVGLFRLDPATGHVIRFRHDPNDPLSLSSNDIKSTLEDREGRFWVATGEGLDEFDRKSAEVKLHIPLLGPVREVVFHEDHEGLLWVGYGSGAGAGLATYDFASNSLTNYLFQTSDHPYTGVYAFCEDKYGALWIGTGGMGLLKFDRANRRFLRYRNVAGDPESLAEDHIPSLLADREGNIWVGLHSREPNVFSTRPAPFRDLLQGLGNVASDGETLVSALYQDRHGILWMGWSSGLNRLDPDGRHTFYSTGENSVGAGVLSIVEDSSGNLWLGTVGQGIKRLDRRTRELETYSHSAADPRSLSDDLVPRLLFDRSGTLWAATWDGLNKLDPLTDTFQVYKVDPNTWTGRYLDLAEDRDGVLWLGSDSGLLRFDPKSAKFVAFKHDPGVPGSIRNDRVNSVFIDHAGELWVGTQNGLDRFNRADGTFTTYAERQGLRGNAVSCLLEDRLHNLWMSTNRGISRFDPRTIMFSNYSSADGLRGGDLTGWGACAESSSGEMLFGGYSGAFAFNPEQVVDSPSDVSVVLTDFRLFGKSVPVGAQSPLKESVTYAQHITLSHQQSNFSLEFASLDYLSSETDRYRYRLEGLDSQWHEVAGDQRIVNYVSLPAGKYVFHVQAASSRGPWNEPGAMLAFTILPPWWGTWWFRVLALAMFLALARGLHLWRIRQLRRQEKQLRDVINAVPANVWSTTPDGAVDFINQRWKELTGLSLKGALGWNWESVVHPDDRSEFTAHWHSAIKNGQAMEHEARVRRADGEYRWLFIRNVPLRDEWGNIIRWYGASLDTDDLKRAEKERERLRRARQVAEAANRAKSEFLATMSHELRTPLNGILGYAQILLRDRSLNERHLSAVEVIHGCGEQLLTLINDVLDLAKIEANRLDVHAAEVCLPEFLHGVLDLMSVSAQQKGLRLEADWEPGLPARIRVDEQCLRRVLLNLLSNAVKFTDQGSVTLRVRFSPPERLRFEVHDTGIGLREDQLERIFEPFVQVVDWSRRAGGTGLGLTISRRLVERMGGELRAESHFGKDSTFAFELHVPVVEQGPAATLPALVTGYEGPARKILVVDDEAVSRAVLADWVRPLGFDVAEAVTGAQALEKALALRPDLILMDLAMPQVDGLEAIRSLRRAEDLRNVPVIAISASASEHEAAKSLAAGADAFLPKPVDFVRLQGKLGELLEIKWTYNPPPEPREERASHEMLTAPPVAEINVLYDLARQGCMSDITRHAAQIASLGERYRPFARELQRLARAYQSQAILQLVEQYRKSKSSDVETGR